MQHSILKVEKMEYFGLVHFLCSPLNVILKSNEFGEIILLRPAGIYEIKFSLNLRVKLPTRNNEMAGCSQEPNLTAIWNCI